MRWLLALRWRPARPLGYLLAGPLASVFGARTVLRVGSVIGLVLLAVGSLTLGARARRGSAGRAGDSAE